MRVRATELGYYGDRRQRAGQVFTLTDPKHFSEKWMEKLDKKAGSKQSGKSSQKVHEAPPEDADDFGDEDTNTPTGDQEVI